jgi:hypothetical protein
MLFDLRISWLQKWPLGHKYSQITNFFGFKDPGLTVAKWIEGLDWFTCFELMDLWIMKEMQGVIFVPFIFANLSYNTVRREWRCNRGSVFLHERYRLSWDSQMRVVKRDAPEWKQKNRLTGCIDFNDLQYSLRLIPTSKCASRKQRVVQGLSISRFWRRNRSSSATCSFLSHVERCLTNGHSIGLSWSTLLVVADIVEDIEDSWEGPRCYRLRSMPTLSS